MKMTKKLNLQRDIKETKKAKAFLFSRQEIVKAILDTPPLNEKNIYNSKFKEVYNRKRKLILEAKAEKDALKKAENTDTILDMLCKELFKMKEKKVSDDEEI
jgi:hypothetical protein